VSISPVNAISLAGRRSQCFEACLLGRIGVISTKNHSMTQHTHPGRLEVEVSLWVKPYDIDVVGVVSNIVYVRWMEDLRLAMLDAYLPLDEQMADGIVPAILKVEIEYKRAIQIHDEVLGKMWLSGLEKLRFEVSAEFRANGHVAAVGRQEGCFINLDTKRPVRPPAKLVTRYQELKGGPHHHGD
jgi:acyl-CoA thioester hydrolase